VTRNPLWGREELDKPRRTSQSRCAIRSPQTLQRFSSEGRLCHYVNQCHCTRNVTSIRACLTCGSNRKPLKATASCEATGSDPPRECTKALHSPHRVREHLHLMQFWGGAPPSSHLFGCGIRGLDTPPPLSGRHTSGRAASGGGGGGASVSGSGGGPAAPSTSGTAARGAAAWEGGVCWWRWQASVPLSC